MTFRNKLKDLLSLGLGNISASLIFGFFWLYLASLIPKTEYGELGFLVSIANVGAAISMLGFNAVVVVYESKKENVFPSSFVIVLISANITALATFVLTQNVLVSILIVGVVIFNIIISGLNSQRRYQDFSKHKILRAVTTVIIAIIAYQYFGINGILAGYFLSTLFILKEFNSLMKNKKIEFSLLRSKIPFILHTFSLRLNDEFIRDGDKLLIGSLFGFYVLGSYYFAVQYLFVILTFPQSLSIFLIPEESRGKKNKKIKVISILISLLIAIVSVTFIPYGIDTFLPKYEDSIQPMQILSLAIIPLTIISIQESEFLAKENSRVVLFGNVLQSGFYLVAIILLGQVLGLIGLSIGFVMATIIRSIFNVIMKSVKSKISFE